jgi:DNA-binding NtrC family response regulator
VYVFPVELPPLRERREDIPILAEHFAVQVAAQNNWKPARFESSAMDALCAYRWPGNVRELRNIVERLLLLTDGVVDAAAVALALPLNTATGAATGTMRGALSERVEEFERATIQEELKRHGYHMTNTAKTLGLERSHLYKKCQQLGIAINRE